MIDIRPIVATLIDAGCNRRTMRRVGRADKALQRSNPSARADAGTGAGLSPSAARPPPPLTLSWLQSDKPRGSGGRAPTARTRAVCHMSLSRG